MTASRVLDKYHRLDSVGRNARLRQAVNYAIDRRALTRIDFMCAAPERPTHQYLHAECLST
jgi:ABC-type oligopeptide transport system substrate-binding subunit